MVKSRLGFAGLLLMGTTLLLKVSALGRDMVIAYYFGDSYAADAYLAAFIIPNMLFLLFSYGMKNAFVPSYIESVQMNRGSFHFTHVLKGTVLSSVLICILGLLIAPFIVPLMYPAFDDETTRLAVNIVRILMVSVLFVGSNAMLEAYLDARHQFSLAVISQLIVVLGVLGGAFIFADTIGVYALAIGYSAGAFCSLAVKVIKIKPLTTQWKDPVDWKELQRFLTIFIPVAITATVGQVNLLVDNMFASFFGEGAVTYVNYAKTLVHFPQAIIGVTIGTLIFPLLAKASAEGDHASFKKGIQQGLTTMYFLLLPSIAGLILLLPHVISLFYERGSFTHEATVQTAQIGYYYAGSVLFFSMADVVNKGLYTLKKGYYILTIGIFSVVFNASFNYILTSTIGYTGISLASSLTGLLYFVCGYIILQKESGHIAKWGQVLEAVKITLSVIVMIVLLSVTVFQFYNGWSNVKVILITAAVGATIYFVTAYILNVQAFNTILKKQPMSR